MVARNLDRDGDFLHPHLDTGPFPNLFLVEPPVYALAVVGLRRATGLALEPSGRLVSALAIALGAWGLHGLARRREGPTVALLAVSAFALFPITVRYGRAFQPDALMLGMLLGSLRAWDERRHGGGRGWLVAAWLLTAIGLALKITSAYIVIPLWLVVLRPRASQEAPSPGPLPGGESVPNSPSPARGEGRGEGAAIPQPPPSTLLLLSTLLPALAWYAHASTLLSTGSRASADNAALWLRAASPTNLLQAPTLALIARFVLIRAFTPIGFALAAWAVLARRLDRLWVVWSLSAATALLLMPGKIHHEYYWLALAPIAAVGVARALIDLSAKGECGRLATIALAAGFVASALIQSAGTFRTPREWSRLEVAAQSIAEHIPASGLLVAPEALLFAADRRGCRLESDLASADRAAGEWGGSIDRSEPLALVEFYRDRGARFVADVYDETDDHRRSLHEAIRRRCKILVDRPGFLLAELGPREAEHAAR